MTITDTPERFRLCKRMKLRHKALVDPLFERGESAFAYPLRLKWALTPDTDLAERLPDGAMRDIAPVQFLITVPKRRLRHAVDRVLMRRRIREAYRLLCHPLEQKVRELSPAARLSIGIVYVGPHCEPYARVRSSLDTLLQKIILRLP